MKNKYLKSFVLASVVLGLNIQTQAQDKNEVAQICSRYNFTKLQETKGNLNIGVYILEVNDGEKVFTIKLLKK
ncbi:hypothetical protein CXF68_03760 [Tenacibaculum sp. Bg11-29]|uniref:hypothetical protein n=1 Tax=Tenacibaculum sp. Bg11-29 TaxID=2058306 RepID=UPI000C341E13|nr:hypothetical protein [Tenacibaculum sp. Bg11-29]PKH49868.1 hypothetical protein CXF68_03760 [Tenacibaculum sp. Bg11-29]